MIKQLHVKISGQVQGVGFRYSAREKAKELGLTGWAKNLPDSTIEILAQGKKENLDIFLEWAQKGPSFAEVESVEHDWQGVGDIFDSFEIVV